MALEYKRTVISSQMTTHWVFGTMASSYSLTCELMKSNQCPTLPQTPIQPGAIWGGSRVADVLYHIVACRKQDVACK